MTSASRRIVLAQCAGRHVIAALSALIVVEASCTALGREVLGLEECLAAEVARVRRQCRHLRLLLSLLLEICVRVEAIGLLLREVLGEAYVIEGAHIRLRTQSGIGIGGEVYVGAWEGRVVRRMRRSGGRIPYMARVACRRRPASLLIVHGGPADVSRVRCCYIWESEVVADRS